MPAGLGALRDQPVDAQGAGGEGLGDRGHGDEHAGAGAAQRGQRRRVGQAEREAGHGHRVGHQQIDLVVPVVVVVRERGGGQVEAVRSALGGYVTGVPAKLRLADLGRAGHEQVHPARRAGRPQLGQLGGDRLGGLVAGREEAEAAGRGYGRDQGAGGGAPGHRRAHDGRRAAEEVRPRVPAHRPSVGPPDASPGDEP
nr:hypothetical protein [Micromonospora thermarum]